MKLPACEKEHVFRISSREVNQGGQTLQIFLSVLTSNSKVSDVVFLLLLADWLSKCKKENKKHNLQSYISVLITCAGLNRCFLQSFSPVHVGVQDHTCASRTR